jgi:hypothetical protein
MQLGRIIRDLSEEAVAAEALLAFRDVSLLAQVNVWAAHHDETIGEYTSGAVRRFANLATSEDWLGLMNVVERTQDPGIDCLSYMVGWALKSETTDRTEASCGCGGGGGG